MNIAIFADNFYPQINGVVTTVTNLAQGLAKRGHKILIIAPKYRKVTYPEFHPNVKILTVHGVPALIYPDLKLTLPFHQKIARALLKNKIELIHFHAQMPLGMEAVIISRLLQIPIIGTFHTFFADPQYLKHAKLDYKFIEKLAWRYNNLYYNRCNLVTTPTNLSKQILLKNKLKTPVKVISNGIDRNIFDNSDSSNIREKHSLGGPLCLFVGRIAYEKNLFFLIDAFEKVIQKIPKAKLLIVGGGPQVKEIENYIAKKKLKHNITLLGEIPHSKLVKTGIYAACDLFLTPSKTETQSITVLEAQCNGVPCIGVKAMGIPDVIKNNVNGFVVEPDNLNQFVETTLKILTSEALLKKLQKSTLESVKKHDLNEIINTWEQTYQKVILNNQKKSKIKKILQFLSGKKSS